MDGAKVRRVMTKRNPPPQANRATDLARRVTKMGAKEHPQIAVTALAMALGVYASKYPEYMQYINDVFQKTSRREKQ